MTRANQMRELAHKSITQTGRYNHILEMIQIAAKKGKYFLVLSEPICAHDPDPELIPYLQQLGYTVRDQSKGTDYTIRIEW